MTPEEIRTTAYNAITSALVADHDAKTTGCSGDDDCRQVAELARLAAIAVDALQRIRMLPTGEAWAVRPDVGTRMHQCRTEDEAVHVAAHSMAGGVAVHQWLHEWTEVTD